MLTPHARAIGRPAGPAQEDAVDPARVEGTPAALTSDLIRLIGQEQVAHRISDLVRYASDASPYRYLPQVVALPRTVDDVRAILDYCVRTGRHAGINNRLPTVPRQPGLSRGPPGATCVRVA